MSLLTTPVQHRVCSNISRRRSACSLRGVRPIVCEAQQDEKLRDLVKSMPEVRQPGPAPQAAPIQHSSSYLLRQRQQELGLPLEDAYRAASSSLDDSWRDGSREANEAAANGISVAAKMTARVGKGVLSVALPVGGWAVRQGFKAAAGAVKRSGNERRPRRRGSTDNDIEDK